ncbi:MAG TPA: hypothetical protein VMV10_24265 [Pirellulales bacterium]|nr:hypothetical protein [Pirellulales bacterium]
MKEHRMGRSSLRRACLLFGCAGALALGCSKGKVVDGPPGKAVSGIVRYQGQPVAEAIVTFMSPSHTAYGSTDNEGHFKLSSPGRGENVPFDHYQVTVSKVAAAPTTELTEEQKHTPPDPKSLRSQQVAPPQDLLPAKYKAAESSELSADVAADGPEEFTFELAD